MARAKSCKNALTTFAKVGLLGLALGLTAACQTNTGQGEIVLSQHVQTGLKLYMKELNPTVLAVSEDGNEYAYYYCPDQACRGRVGSPHKAVLDCERHSFSPCKIMARKKEIVWQKPDGTPYTLDELLTP